MTFRRRTGTQSGRYGLCGLSAHKKDRMRVGLIGPLLEREIETRGKGFSDKRESEKDKTSK